MSAGSSQIRILAVDDHPVVRQGIAGLIGIQTDMVLVGEACNGRDAIQQFRTHHPDVTLMDLQMPEMNGIDALIAIRNEFPDARVIVLTTYVGDAHILRALKAGAQAYLLKNTLHKELLATDPSSPCGKEDLFAGSVVPNSRARDGRRADPGRNAGLASDRRRKCEQENADQLAVTEDTVKRRVKASCRNWTRTTEPTRPSLG